jgi:hypothetical protein
VEVVTSGNMMSHLNGKKVLKSHPQALRKSGNCKKGTLKENVRLLEANISCICPHYISCKCHGTGHLPLEIHRKCKILHPMAVIEIMAAKT